MFDFGQILSGFRIGGFERFSRDFGMRYDMSRGVPNLRFDGRYGGGSSYGGGRFSFDPLQMMGMQDPLGMRGFGRYGRQERFIDRDRDGIDDRVEARMGHGYQGAYGQPYGQGYQGYAPAQARGRGQVHAFVPDEAHLERVQQTLDGTLNKEQTVALQMRLEAMGFGAKSNPGYSEVDGELGPKTARAFMDFGNKVLGRMPDTRDVNAVLQALERESSGMLGRAHGGTAVGGGEAAPSASPRQVAGGPRR